MDRPVGKLRCRRLAHLLWQLSLLLSSCLVRSSFSFISTNRLSKNKNDAVSLFAQDFPSDGNLIPDSFQERYSDHLPDWLIRKCVECGWTHPTRIQALALDSILIDGKDVVIQAETGSGKTLSYLLPCLASIDASRSAVQALIVVPTRELGLQVARVAKRLASASADDGSEKIMIMNVLQGSRNRRQRAWAWAEPPHIVIGTPLELFDMVRFAGFKRYNSVQFVVVDEVDACLLNNAGSMTSNIESSTLHELLSKYLSPTYDDGSNVEDLTSQTVQKVIKPLSIRPLSQKRQTVFCSATIPQPRHFLKQCIQNQWTLREPVHISLRTGEQMLPRSIEHAYIVCKSGEKKFSGLRRLMKKILKSSLESPKKVLIFAEPQRPLPEMALALANDVPDGRGFIWKESLGSKDAFNAQAVVSVLRYEDSLSQRASAMEVFREHDPSSTTTLRVLLSTDMAARGLDITDITHVIHYDMAPDADTYTHRAGRTGRLGRSGQVISILPPEQEFALKRLGNKLNIDIKCIGRQRTDVKQSNS